ncbi:uncharacterized protein LOC123878870 isoform X2 [Maniola jurtina]|uniref:uncharacterized protein LOC123878870 isoform X2 n=1 Tax=Maniola jurtina TaxID=191418 RepID=UPI001E68793E|nr:uncharacterized protein LOC123878870 isoform X2 [Maniola jurtina]
MICQEQKVKRDTPKDDNITAKKPDEKLKKSIYSVSTPRNFIQKSSAADIYASKGSVTNVKALKKTSTPNRSSNNESPTKDLLKSSPSTVSQISTKSHRLNKSITDSKTRSSARYTEKPNNVTASSKNMGVAKKLPFTNVTVNSPIAKKKLNVDNERVNTKKNKRIDEISKATSDIVDRDDNRTKEKKITKEVVKRKEIISNKVVLPERRRTKTRTLEEEEIKILTPDVVDNNLEMLNLAKQLTAQPKAFYVGLNEENLKPKLVPNEKPQESDEEVSYEDDFESYESDFDSYQSDHTSSAEEDRNCRSIDKDHDSRSNDSNDSNLQESDEIHSKEERMLDSGNFELRDPRSVSKPKPLDYILENSQETDKKISLTDEGFQEMSSSSGLSSMKTVHIDILDRPLFIDFTKSKENRRKKKIFERLKQRAQDILSMVTLHEMSYDLYEMKPIPYDLYMATFGRYNYTQTAVQTFDDGVTEEVQTDDILVKDKWTQNPIEFSNNYFNNEENSIKKKDSVDNFAFLINNDQDDTNNIIDENYKSNPLRIYLEQKDGVGSNEISPYENYKSKLNHDKYDVKKLRAFLKKFESRISNVLSINSGNTMTNLNKTSKFPFSNEYLLITTREDDTFLNNSQIIAAIFSDTTTNLLITVHNKSSNGFKKCVLCLWDLSVAILKPLKVLIATDNVKIGLFRGSTDGILVGALYDGTILLWDLTEEPNWCNDVVNEENTAKMTQTKSKINCETGTYIRDVHNLKQHTLQACAYTSSGLNVCNNEQADTIVGLEFMGENTTWDYDRKILAQLCALQSTGILTIWSIIQEKTKNLKHDIGKALWSKMKLERNQTINLLQHIDFPIDLEMTDLTFNLNSAKKRMSKKRNERNRCKIVRPKSAILNAKCQEDSSNVASKRNMVENNNTWENGVTCNHLKVMNLNGVENYLVAKNAGEVLCCRRYIGSVKIKTFCVASAVSSVTCIEASPHGLPYFLAATDCGTVNMCSLLDHRVLLTLDCRNGPTTAVEKYQSDHKGRYLGSATITNHDAESFTDAKLPITTVTWLHPNPFCIMATLGTSVVVWELTHSDIRAKCRSDGVVCATNSRSLALLNKDGEVQVFKLTDSRENCLELFQKYVALL